MASCLLKHLIVQTMVRNSELFSACIDDHLHKRKTLRSINYIIGSFLNRPTQPFQLFIALFPFYVQAKMILNQISYLDCFAFLIFLAPQLLIRVGLVETVSCVVAALPFFCMYAEIERLKITDISSQWFNYHIHSSKNDSLSLTNKNLLLINTPLPSRTLSFAAFAMHSQRSLPTSARSSFPRVSHCPFSGSAC